MPIIFACLAHPPSRALLRRRSRAAGPEAGRRILPPAQRPEGRPPPRLERAAGDRLRRLSRRLEERAGRADRVRPLLRAHDVPGDEERPQLRHPAPGDRGPVQRLHVRGHDGLFRDGLDRVSRAGPLPRGRAAGVPAHRRSTSRSSTPSARWSRTSGGRASTTCPTGWSRRPCWRGSSPRAIRTPGR